MMTTTTRRSQDCQWIWFLTPFVRSFCSFLSPATTNLVSVRPQKKRPSAHRAHFLRIRSFPNSDMAVFSLFHLLSFTFCLSFVFNWLRVQLTDIVRCGHFGASRN